VLLKREKMVNLPNKLSLPFLGPYEVVVQRGNDVEIRHLATHAITTESVLKLKIFHGDKTSAQLAANLDFDQHFVDMIEAWKGHPGKVTSLQFRVRFKDGDVVWLPYSKDISQTRAYEEFVLDHRPLRHLAFVRPQDVRNFTKSFVKATITGYQVNDELYVDLRSYNFVWYDQLEDLPDRFDKKYVLLYRVTAVNTHTIYCYCPVFDEHWCYPRGPNACNAYWCYAWGHVRDFNPLTMILITPQLCRSTPSLISTDLAQQRRVLHYHFPDLADSLLVGRKAMS
jgi:hypothetical protein